MFEQKTNNVNDLDASDMSIDINDIPQEFIQSDTGKRDEMS